MEVVLRFLRDLARHNEKAWFDSHRAVYLEAKARFEETVLRLIGRLEALDPSLRGLGVPDCTYRIYRDTRFAADKTPYKTHMGAYFAPHGKKSGYAGYYLHVEPGASGPGCSLLTAGLYCPSPAVLRSVREEIVDHGVELRRAMQQAEAEAGFRLSTADALRRTPTGFPSGTEWDELLRQRHFYVERSVESAFLTACDFEERAVAAFMTTRPLIEQLNRAVAYAFEQM